jgi:hypothetical protein
MTYSMGIHLTTVLAVLFAILAVANASLMAWLWRFPLDAQGQTTAPRAWRLVHRGIGYVFALIYLGMLPTMLPRLWQYQEFTWVSWMHACVALLIAPLLIFKILVVRNVVPLGSKLPWIGGAVLASAVLVAGVAAPSSVRLQSGPAMPGKAIAMTRCVQCHGPSRLLKPGDSWPEIKEEMVERARKTGRPLTRAEAEAAVAYLSGLTPSTEDGRAGDDEGGHGRRRWRHGGDDHRR